MNRDKWLQIVDKIEAKFGISKQYKEKIGVDIPGEKDVIEFDGGPLGLVKLEWYDKPKVKEEKTIYSNRVGSDVKVYKVYDDDARVNYMKAYKWSQAREEWEEIDQSVFGGG